MNPKARDSNYELRTSRRENPMICESYCRQMLGQCFPRIAQNSQNLSLEGQKSAEICAICGRFYCKTIARVLLFHCKNVAIFIALYLLNH